MSKVFYYELKRLICNKVFIGLLVINCIYGWTILVNDIIMGAAYTAPFSQWSYGAYLGKTMPIAIMTLMFLLGIYHSKKEKAVESLTSVAPVKPIIYVAVRMAALTICFLIIFALLIGLSVYFYISFFDYHDFVVFIIPSLLVLAPCIVFALGIGHVAGRIHYGLIYVAATVLLLAGFSAADFFCTGYFTKQPLTLPLNTDGEPDFHISVVFLMGRFSYIAAGAALPAIGANLFSRKKRKA